MVGNAKNSKRGYFLSTFSNPVIGIQAELLFLITMMFPALRGHLYSKQLQVLTIFSVAVAFWLAGWCLGPHEVVVGCTDDY